MKYEYCRNWTPELSTKYVLYFQIPLRQPALVRDAGQSSRKAPGRLESLSANKHLYRLRGSSDPEELHIGASVFYAGSQVARDPPKAQVVPTQSASSNLLLLAVKPCSNPIFSFCRLYFMTYFPSGFWSRLIVRVLADTSLYNVVKSLFCLPEELLSKSPEIRAMVDRDPEWHCWQTGLELFYMGFEVRASWKGFESIVLTLNVYSAIIVAGLQNLYYEQN